MGDLGHSASVCGLPAVALFCSSFSNVYHASALLTPEVALILTDYLVAYETSQSLNARAIMGFDSGVEVLTHIGVEGLLPLIIFGLFTWFVVYMFLTGAILPWSSYSHSQFARSYVYIFSFSKETRVQLEVVLQTTVLFLFYWAMIIMAFDDDKEETIEYVDTMYFYFFTFIVTYFFCKHSTHYFSFLEASATGSRSAMFLVTQFKGDFLALFSMILRFYSLLLRLNVYDILDDCLDFYYVFMGDFDDDEYINELFFGVHGTLFFTVDNQDDRSFLLEDEFDFSVDLFYSYFLLWGKFFYFLFYTVELIARFGLAFYVIYLVLFEIYGVNCSYREDRQSVRSLLV